MIGRYVDLVSRLFHRINCNFTVSFHKSKYRYRFPTFIISFHQSLKLETTVMNNVERGKDRANGVEVWALAVVQVLALTVAM